MVGRHCVGVDLGALGHPEVCAGPWFRISFADVLNAEFDKHRDDIERAAQNILPCDTLAPKMGEQWHPLSIKIDRPNQAPLFLNVDPKTAGFSGSSPRMPRSSSCSASARRPSYPRPSSRNRLDSPALDTAAAAEAVSTSRFGGSALRLPQERAGVSLERQEASRRIPRSVRSRSGSTTSILLQRPARSRPEDRCEDARPFVQHVRLGLPIWNANPRAGRQSGYGRGPRLRDGPRQRILETRPGSSRRKSSPPSRTAQLRPQQGDRPRSQ